MPIHEQPFLRVFYSQLRRLTGILILSLCTPAAALAQSYLAANFSVSPNVVNQGACYTIRVSNWPGAVLNVGYVTTWTGQQYIWGWPSLDYNGNAVICTSSSTQTGP